MTPSRLWLCPVERRNIERTLLRAPLEYSNLSVNFKRRRALAQSGSRGCLAPSPHTT